MSRTKEAVVETHRAAATPPRQEARFRKRADGCSHIRYWRLKERRQYRGSRVDGGVDGPCLDRLDELDRKWPERSEQRDGRS